MLSKMRAKSRRNPPADSTYEVLPQKNHLRLQPVQEKTESCQLGVRASAAIWLAYLA
jgi:hypothetical protein